MIYRATHLIILPENGDVLHYIAWTLMNSGMSYWAAFFLTMLHRSWRHAHRAGCHTPVESAPHLVVVIVFIGLLVILNSLQAGFLLRHQGFSSPFPSESFVARLTYPRMN